MVKRQWMASVVQKLDTTALNSLRLCWTYILPWLLTLQTTWFAVFTNDHLPWKHENKSIFFIVVTESVNLLKPHGNHMYHICNFFFFLWRCSPTRAIAFLRFLDHTQRLTTAGRILDDWSARRRDLYLTTHNTHRRRTSMPLGGIRTHNLSRRATADLRLRPRGHWDRRL